MLTDAWAIIWARKANRIPREVLVICAQQRYASLAVLGELNCRASLESPPVVCVFYLGNDEANAFTLNILEGMKRLRLRMVW